MFNFAEIFDKISTLVTEKKDVVFTILIFAILGSLSYFLSTQVIREKEVGAKDIELLKSVHLDEIKKIRDHQIDSEIEFQRSIADCKRDCRIRLDSIEDYYANKYRTLHETVKRIDKKVNDLIQ